MCPEAPAPRAPEDEEVPEQDIRKDEETDKRCDPTAYPIVRQYHCVLPGIPAKNGLPSLWADRDRSSHRRFRGRVSGRVVSRLAPDRRQARVSHPCGLIVTDRSLGRCPSVLGMIARQLCRLVAQCRACLEADCSYALVRQRDPALNDTKRKKGTGYLSRAARSARTHMLCRTKDGNKGRPLPSPLDLRRGQGRLRRDRESQ